MVFVATTLNLKIVRKAMQTPSRVHKRIIKKKPLFVLKIVMKSLSRL